MMSKLIAMTIIAVRYLTFRSFSCPFKSALARSGSDSFFIERSLPINPSEFPRPQHNFDNILSDMAWTVKHVDLQQRV